MAAETLHEDYLIQRGETSCEGQPDTDEPALTPSLKPKPIFLGIQHDLPVADQGDGDSLQAGEPVKNEMAQKELERGPARSFVNRRRAGAEKKTLAVSHSFIARSKSNMVHGSFHQSHFSKSGKGRSFGDFTGWGSMQMKDSFASPRSEGSRDDLNDPTSKRTVVRMVLMLLFVLVFGNAFVQVVVRWGIDPLYHDANKEEYFSEIDPLKDTYSDIAEEVIPAMKSWYRNHSSERSTFANQATEGREDRIACARFWQNALNEAANVTHSDPRLIQMWLRTLGLHEHPLMVAALGDFLTYPQPIDAMTRQGADCAGANPALGTFLCKAMHDPELRLFPDWTSAELRVWLPRAVNWAVLLEVLTSKASDDTALYFALFDFARNGVMRRMLDAIEARFEGPNRAFLKQKYTGIAQAGFDQAVRMMGNIQEQSVHGAAHVRAQLQLNILEAANLDRANGFDNNTHVAIALATGAPFPSSVDAHKFKWRLGKAWVDAYTSWNLAFTLTSADPFVSLKLLVPSVGCASERSFLGGDFIRERVFSLQLGLLHSYSPDFHDVTRTKAWHSASPSGNAAARALGAINRELAQVSAPFQEQVERMLSELCGGKCHGSEQLRMSNTDPVAVLLDDEGFKCYAGFLLWGTVLIAGFGTEFFVAVSILGAGAGAAAEPPSQAGPALATGSGSAFSDKMQRLQTLWLFAQFIFSLFLSIALGSAVVADYTGLPFLVLGLWKFGFPETYMFFLSAMVSPHGGEALYRPGVRKWGLPLWMWSLSGWADVLNGVGTALHHGAAAGMLCLLTARCAPPHRCIQACCLPLVLQHWFVITRYVSARLYLALMLLTEAFFEWTVLSNWECAYEFRDPIRHCGAVMLGAHWIYLAASLLSLLTPEDPEADPADASNDNDDMSVRTTTTTGTKQRRGTITKWTEQLRRSSSEEVCAPSRDGSVRLLSHSRNSSVDGGGRGLAQSFLSQASPERWSDEGGESSLAGFRRHRGAGTEPQSEHAGGPGQKQRRARVQAASAAASRQPEGAVSSGFEVSLGYLGAPLGSAPPGAASAMGSPQSVTNLPQSAVGVSVDWHVPGPSSGSAVFQPEGL